MRIYIVEALQSLEQAVIKNRWFTLAVVTIALGGGALFYASVDKRIALADCFKNTSDIAYGSPRHTGEISTPWGESLNASIASGDLAKAYFGMCLVINGVDTRSVPAFEELFPQITVSSNFQNESFGLLESEIFEGNEDEGLDEEDFPEGVEGLE